MKKSKDTERVKHKKWRQELPAMAGAFLPHNLWRELPQFIKAIFVVCVLALAVLACFFAGVVIMTDRVASIEMVMISILIAVVAVVCNMIVIFYASCRVAAMSAVADQLLGKFEKFTVALRKSGGLEFWDMFDSDPTPLDEDDDDDMMLAFLNQNREGLFGSKAAEAGVVPEAAKAITVEEQVEERIEEQLQPALEEQPIVAEESADGTKEYEIRHSHPLPEGVTQLVPQGITQELPGKGAIDTAMSIQPESNRVGQQAGNQPEEQFKLEASSVRAQADELGVPFSTLYTKLTRYQVSNYSELPNSELFALRKNRFAS